MADQATLRIGDKSPDFECQTQLGPLKWHEYIEGKWALLCSHPKDFTPVCATELGRLSQMKDQFAEINCVVAGLSVDSVDNHKKWVEDINDMSSTNLDYPIISDPDREISKAWGMLDQTNFEKPGLPLTVRSVFFIGPDKAIKAIITYPASTGRNFDEIYRVVDSLQMTVNHKVATPVDWKKGGKCVVVPSISTEDAKNIFPKGVEEVRPWIRFTPDPRD
nr:cysteine peroxiredoxin [Paramoeba perurans]